eukprot:TRINITY_DN20596_c0_g1_i3.p1 TRINITY_DN20596_c0_g1~~TRINITY_DN20596_c0_g1_i3.p1  ORF type:complete len:233 (-),score=43.27 TRINITY_DN20596_c0_g1_i3:8-706(-)
MASRWLCKPACLATAACPSPRAVLLCEPIVGVLSGWYVVLQSGRRFQLPAGESPTSIGRWRQSYSPTGHSLALGWGRELFQPDETVEDDPSSVSAGTAAASADRREAAKTGDEAWSGEVVEWVPEEEHLDEAHPATGVLRSYVDTWMQLLREKGRERQQGQLDYILKVLGPRPPDTKPMALCFWIAGLINPLPALGVAPEIRPAMLSATTTDEAVEIAAFGLRRSIDDLKLL